MSNGNPDFFDDNKEVIEFLETLTPGIMVELQYDHQPPACGIFQGFLYGNVILTEYDCFADLVHISTNSINAVTPIDE